jgi:hypothetical protein
MSTPNQNSTAEKQGPDYTQLAQVLREQSEALQNRPDMPDDIRMDVTELLRVLARMVEGKDVYRAFGAPGDWGYGTAIGAALAKAYRGGAH